MELLRRLLEMSPQQIGPTDFGLDDELENKRYGRQLISRGEEFVTEPVTKANHQGAVSVKKVVTKKANAGLTDAQVKHVRKLLAEGKKVVDVARIVGTSERTVGRVRDYESPYNN